MDVQHHGSPRRRPSHRLARGLARRLGLDRNPLRRRSDRVESAGLLVAVVLVAVAAAGGVLVGGHVADAGLRRAGAQQAARHRTAAILLAGTATATGQAAELGPVPVDARVRWSVGGRTHTGTIATQQGLVRGDTTTIWVDSRGRPVEPPATRSDAMADAAAVGLGVPVGMLVLVWIGWRLGRWRLDRARYAVWDDDWSRVEPSWTGRRRR
jgi:hypothetical protein